MSAIVLDLESLKHLEDQAIAAAGVEGLVEFRPVPLLGEHKVAMISGEGVKILEKVSRRNHLLGSIASVQDWLTYAATRHALLSEQEDEQTSSIVVWVAENDVVIVLNDACEVRPHNGAYCKLPYSPEFELVKAWAEKQTFHDQKSFVRLLRSQIGQCLVPESGLVLIASGGFDPRKELIETFSVLKFETRTQSGGRVTARSEFLGKEESADITSGTSDNPRDIPSIIDLYVQPYRDLLMRERYRIPCEVVIDYEKCQLALQPSLTDLQSIQDQATAAVLDQIMSKAPASVNGFLGKP